MRDVARTGGCTRACVVTPTGGLRARIFAPRITLCFHQSVRRKSAFAGPTVLEPATSGVTGRRDIH